MDNRHYTTAAAQGKPEDIQTEAYSKDTFRADFERCSSRPKPEDVTRHAEQISELCSPRADVYKLKHRIRWVILTLDVAMVHATHDIGFNDAMYCCQFKAKIYQTRFRTLVHRFAQFMQRAGIGAVLGLPFGMEFM